MQPQRERQVGERQEHMVVQKATRSYYAEVAAEALSAQIALIEQVIEVAFGDLGARHLEVRVIDGRRCTAGCA